MCVFVILRAVRTDVTIIMHLYVSSFQAHVGPQPSHETHVSHPHTNENTDAHIASFYLGIKTGRRRTFHSHTHREELASHGAQCFHPRRGQDVASFTVELERPGALQLSCKRPPIITIPCLCPEGSRVAFTPDAHAAVTNLRDLTNTGK